MPGTMIHQDRDDHRLQGREGMGWWVGGFYSGTSGEDGVRIQIFLICY